MQWHYINNSNVSVAVEEEELIRMAQDGRLKPSDMVWNDTMGEEWVAASAVEILFAGSPSAPAPASGSARDDAVSSALAEASRLRTEGTPGPVIRATVESLLIDAGVDVASASTIADSVPVESPDTTTSHQQVLWSGLLLASGVLLTVLTFALAEPGMYFVVAGAPIVAGLAFLFKGLSEPDEQSTRIARRSFLVMIPVTALVVGAVVFDRSIMSGNPLPPVKRVESVSVSHDYDPDADSFRPMPIVRYEQLRACLDNANRLIKGPGGEILATLRIRKTDGSEVQVRINEFTMVLVDGGVYEPASEHQDRLYSLANE